MWLAPFCLQSKDNKRVEYVLEPVIAQGVKIKGRKER